MKLTAPIYRLKREAKQLARQNDLPLVKALDHVAAQEGYSSWSLLAARYAASSPAARLYGRLNPGDLVLIGARPRQGKTMLALELAAEAVKAGQQSAFFTLEYTEQDVLDRLGELGLVYDNLRSSFVLDCSDAICADHIIAKLQAAPECTLVVVDYLQLLDQRRDLPPLAEQLKALSDFAAARRLVVVCIAQIQRAFDPTEKSAPDLGDVRLPNPVDLALFTKTCFLHNGVVAFQSA